MNVFLQKDSYSGFAHDGMNALGEKVLLVHFRDYFDGTMNLWEFSIICTEIKRIETEKLVFFSPVST